MADPELGADGIGVHLPSPVKHTDVIMMIPPPVPSSQTTTSHGTQLDYQYNLRKRGSPDQMIGPGDGMLDINQLYSFSLPMTVTNTPHNTLRGMSGMGIRDVRLVQVIHLLTDDS